MRLFSTLPLLALVSYVVASPVQLEAYRQNDSISAAPSGAMVSDLGSVDQAGSNLPNLVTSISSFVGSGHAATLVQVLALVIRTVIGLLDVAIIPGAAAASQQKRDIPDTANVVAATINDIVATVMTTINRISNNGAADSDPGNKAVVKRDLASTITNVINIVMLAINSALSNTRQINTAS